MFNPDKPIQKSDDDSLKRSSFSKQLAEAILSYTNKENFTISLYGKWGSGKTSIINMVIEEIEAQTKNNDNKPVIVKFDPWNYSDRTQLITQFFNRIRSEIGLNSPNKKLEAVGSALQKYSSVIDYTTFIPIVGKYLEPLKAVLEGVGKNITETAISNESVENVKNEVVQALSAQQQRIIVIIDDIDRLNNEQIRLIFQLVNCVAGFPNMIYLLSFDKSVVVRALEEEQKCNGEEYLEKIIQVPFEVPAIKISAVHKIFIDRLKQLQKSCANLDQDYWNTVFVDSVSPFIRTVRDVNRVINVFSFKYGMMRNETNCIDLLALTTFQVCAPNIFDWVYSNIDRLTGSIYDYKVTNTVADQQKNKEQIIDEFKHVYNNPELMLEVLQPLFPKFSWNVGGYRYGNETVNELRYKQRIACPDRAQVYFRLSLEDIPISKLQINQSILQYNSEKLDAFFHTLIQTGDLVEYLNELNAYAKDIPKDRMQLFLEKLISLQTIEKLNEKKGVFDIVPASYCHNCCWSILKEMGSEKASDAIKSLVDSSNSNMFSILVGMVVSIEESYGIIGDSPSKNYRFIPEESISEIEKSLLERINKMAETENIFDLNFKWNIIDFWKYADKDSMDKYIKKMLFIPQNVPKFLVYCANFWHGKDTIGWSFKEENFSEYISADDANTKILNLKGKTGFSELKYQEKEIAIAYYLWYNSGKKDNEITKGSIDALIPDWEKYKCK